MTSGAHIVVARLLPTTSFPCGASFGVVMRIDVADPTMLRSRLVAVAATVWLMLWMVIGGAHHHESRTNSTDLEIVAGEALTSLESSQVVRDQLPPDHAHAERDSSTHHDDQFMAAALTPSVAALASFGAAVSPVGGAGWSAYPAAAPGRGPPTVLAVRCAGRDLLTRLCLSRR